MNKLDSKIELITDIFRNNERYEAHVKLKPVLIEMAKDRSYLDAIIKQNIQKEGFLAQKRINPVLAFPIFENKDFSFVAHAFMPLPDRNVDLTHQSIHHHGNLLLSTVNCWGEGYESILFKKGYKITEDEAFLEVDKHYVNTLYNYEFIDSNTPHVVYYPKEITITYALWSNEKESAADGMKKLGVLRKYKKQLRNVIKMVGAERFLNLNKVEFMDFYVDSGKVIPMKERVRYQEASSKNYIENLFYFLQQIAYDDTNSLKNSIDQLPMDFRKKVEPLLHKLVKGEEIVDSLEANQMGIGKVNLKREDLEKIFPV